MHGQTFTSTSFRATEHARLDGALRRHFAGASWAAVRRLIRSGKVKVNGETVLGEDLDVAPGAEIEVRLNAPKPDARRLDRTALRFVDTHLVVVNKPPGISSVPHADEETSLQDLVERTLRSLAATKPAPRGAPFRLFAVHRLDKVSSGLLVFARTLHAQRNLKEQFRSHRIERRYLALAYGGVPSTTLSSRLVQDRSNHRRGSTSDELHGQVATTEVKTLERFPHSSLIECRLGTGRTHQIRIHLAEYGHPLVGEKVYTGSAAPVLIDAPRTLLHAARLAFEHPTTGEWLSFEQPLPRDFQEVLDRERLGRGGPLVRSRPRR